MPADDALCWVVGSRGLLGEAVVRELTRDGRAVRRARVPWADPDAAESALTGLATEIATGDRPWRVWWCAGAAVIGSDPGALRVELRLVAAFLDRLAVLTAGRPASGAVFLASSAGGVYAGSQHPPFTEETPPRPISPYGEAKLEAEELARGFAARSGVPVLLGRIANLYGPGQDITKTQGLVSQLCRAYLRREPQSIYVSLDTARDYVYADDAARMAVAGLDRAAGEAPGTAVVKILHSRSVTTVAALLGELRRITRRRPLVVLAASPLARFQVRQLRFRSVVWPDLDNLVSTGLGEGMAATLAALALDAHVGRRAGTVG